MHVIVSVRVNEDDDLSLDYPESHQPRLALGLANVLARYGALLAIMLTTRAVR